jgi:hypothetical protein
MPRKVPAELLTTRPFASVARPSIATAAAMARRLPPLSYPELIQPFAVTKAPQDRPPVNQSPKLIGDAGSRCRRNYLIRLPWQPKVPRSRAPQRSAAGLFAIPRCYPRLRHIEHGIHWSHRQQPGRTIIHPDPPISSLSALGKRTEILFSRLPAPARLPQLLPCQQLSRLLHALVNGRCVAS